MQASKQIKGVSIAFPVEDSSMKIILNHEGGGKWRQRSGWVDDASLCYPHSNLPSPRFLSTIHTQHSRHTRRFGMALCRDTNITPPNCNTRKSTTKAKKSYSSKKILSENELSAAGENWVREGSLFHAQFQRSTNATLKLSNREYW